LKGYTSSDQADSAHPLRDASICCFIDRSSSTISSQKHLSAAPMTLHPRACYGILICVAFASRWLIVNYVTLESKNTPSGGKELVVTRGTEHEADSEPGTVAETAPPSPGSSASTFFSADLSRAITGFPQTTDTGGKWVVEAGALPMKRSPRSKDKNALVPAQGELDQTACLEDNLERAWMITDARKHSKGQCVYYESDLTCTPQCFWEGKPVPKPKDTEYGDTVCHEICQVESLYADNVRCNIQRSVVPVQENDNGKYVYQTSAKKFVVQIDNGVWDVFKGKFDPTWCMRPKPKKYKFNKLKQKFAEGDSWPFWVPWFLSWWLDRPTYFALFGLFSIGFLYGYDNEKPQVSEGKAKKRSGAQKSKKR